MEGASWILNYRDLEHEVGRLAAVLYESGVRRGHFVPMLMGRSPRFVVALLAVVRCGAAYVPIDQSSPSSRQQAMLEALSSPVALTDASVPVAGLEKFTVIDVGQALLVPAPAKPPAWPDLAPEAPVYGMFTSGSTGMPKGVVVPHRAVDRLVWEPDYIRIDETARWGQLSSIAFDASTLEIWAPLLHGGCCVVQEEALPSLDVLADFIVERKLTDVWLTAALFNVMVDDWIKAFSGLRQLLTGGERVSPAHAAACLAAHPALRLINGYGPTENTTFSLCHTITPTDAGSGAELPIGTPIHGTDILIMSPEGQAVPDGEPGELWVGGEGVALGYLNDERLTAEKFVRHRDGSWYRTGDRVRRREDGLVDFLGRTDRQVKVQGHRIELDEVERILSACPGVGTAAVLIAGDNAETRHLVGFVAGVGTARPDGQDIFAWLETRLPPVMIPHALHVMERLPVNLNGKVDRYALASELEALARPDQAGPAEAEFATETERVLAQVWSRCFAVRGAPIPIRPDSNFLALGGTSLLALRVAAEVRSLLGRELAPIDVLRHPVLAEQARWIDLTARSDRHASDGPRSTTGITLTRGQVAVLSASGLDGSGCAYLVHQALVLRPAPDPEALRQAFAMLIARHPMLRTAIQHCAEMGTGTLKPELPDGWWCHQGRLPAPPRDFDWPEDLLAVINRPLDLGQAPMRADWWALDGDALLLVWTVHHVAVDEMAVNRVLDELGQVLTHGAAALTPVYGSAYAFPVVERAWSDDVAVERQARAFAKSVAGLECPLPPAPAAGDERPLRLPEDVVAALQDRCAAWGCTPFVPLLAACGMALQDSFGEGWRHVVTPFSRRCEPELMEPVGYLLDMRLIEAGARPGEMPADTLRRVHGEIIAAQQPRFQSAERLAEALSEISPEAGAALFQFGLTWRHRPRAGMRFGAATALPVAVPQRGSRFGLCLHLAADGAAITATLEGVRDAFETGAAQRFGRALVARLEALATLDAPVILDLPEARILPPAEEAAARRRQDEVGRAATQAWRTILGRPPAGPQDGFLAAGGSSLLALRMAAHLRRTAGLELDVAGFLARPDFAGLCRQLAAPRGALAGRKPMYSLLGPPDFARYVVVIPGHGGTAVSMFTFASELRRHLPEDYAIAMIDLQSMVRQAPLEGVTHFVREQLVQVVRDLGEQRLDAVVGASLGGVFGAHLVAALGEGVASRIPLCLVDTYAPRILRPGRQWVVKRKLVKWLRHPMNSLVTLVENRSRRWFATPEMSPGPLPEPETPWVRQVWRQSYMELATTPLRVPGARATLIHSRPTSRTAGVLRWADRNGFSGREFDSLRVISVDELHRDLFHRSAAWVAEAMRSR